MTVETRDYQFTWTILDRQYSQNVRVTAEPREEAADEICDLREIADDLVKQTYETVMPTAPLGKVRVEVLRLNGGPEDRWTVEPLRLQLRGQRERGWRRISQLENTYAQRDPLVTPETSQRKYRLKYDYDGKTHVSNIVVSSLTTDDEMRIESNMIDVARRTIAGVINPDTAYETESTFLLDVEITQTSLKGVADSCDESLAENGTMYTLGIELLSLDIDTFEDELLDITDRLQPATVRIWVRRRVRDIPTSISDYRSKLRLAKQLTEQMINCVEDIESRITTYIEERTEHE